jgi:hypothetical protein
MLDNIKDKLFKKFIEDFTFIFDDFQFEGL